LVGLLLLHCLIAMAEAEYLNTKIQSSHWILESRILLIEWQ
jgi:hypothetical protein